jgi:hypothetical protein
VGRKALKGKAQERRELKEVLRDLWDETNRRKGSQTLGTALLGVKAKASKRFSKRESEKKGPEILKC